VRKLFGYVVEASGPLSVIMCCVPGQVNAPVFAFNCRTAAVVQPNGCSVVY
jgi:hypothetical protein